LTETDEYDAIFTALKHPVRRQILLLLEQKGEATFTDIQKIVDTNDTGLISYHLKELSPLIDQTVRGKYRLSEIGQTSMVLFRKVELEKQRTSTTVRREIERLIGEIVFLFFIVGFTLMAPLSVGIYMSVQNLVATSNLALEYMVGAYLAGFSGMVVGAVLFVFYDRHYFSKHTRTNMIHSVLFAIGVSLLLVYPAYSMYVFDEGALSIVVSPSRGNIGWLFKLCPLSLC
jgi:DNA-binding transcriptional ArsR family regulator